ncbi:MULTISPECIES: cytochrome c oxidase subunit 2A [Bacillaceae]|uniref:Cytochrome c oxidase subunit 2A n=1 Tax=Evansella alkalicola TaxID=745819 RepID=A0ABS6K280_9BACI|nr:MULTISPECIES: cytochrome c oxidase subunit 2A [Bacillaceae]MBU9723792.1 cytochrome c oxidase subunit 2A [Bacillus alkalicola]
MSKTNLETNHNVTVTKKEDESSLKGTLIFVFFVGGFILVSWLVVFFLFLSRT